MVRESFCFNTFRIFSVLPPKRIFKRRFIDVDLLFKDSDNPRFDINPNTGVPFSLEYDEMIPAEQKIYHDKDHPSHIILPIVK